MARNDVERAYKGFASAIMGITALAVVEWALRPPDQADPLTGLAFRVIDLATGQEVPTVGGAQALAVYYGDVNKDGVVDSGDLTAAQSLMQSIAAGQPVDSDAVRRADVNGDGAVTDADIALIQQYVLGMIPQFPIEAGVYAFAEGGQYQVQAAVSNRSLRNGLPVAVTLDIEMWAQDNAGVEYDFLARTSTEVAFAASEGKVVARDFTIPLGRGGSVGRICARLYPGPDTPPYDAPHLLAEASRGFGVSAAPIVKDVTLASIRFTRQTDMVDAPLVEGSYQLSDGDRYTVAMQLLVTKTQGGAGLPVDVSIVWRLAYTSGDGAGGVLQGVNVPSGATVGFTQSFVGPQGNAGRTGAWSIEAYLDGQPAKTFTVPLAAVASPIQYGGIITLSRRGG